MSKLLWSATHPTEAGWYWYRPFPNDEPVIVELYKYEFTDLPTSMRISEKRPMVNHYYCQHSDSWGTSQYHGPIERMTGDWAGPIEKPEEV